MIRVAVSFISSLYVVEILHQEPHQFRWSYTLEACIRVCSCERGRGAHSFDTFCDYEVFPHVSKFLHDIFVEVAVYEFLENFLLGITIWLLIFLSEDTCLLLIITCKTVSQI